MMPSTNKKKVCIVTVYNSLNCGSYWQAFALGEAISELGYDVVYYKRNNQNGASSSRINQLKRLLKYCLNRDFKNAISFLASLKGFIKMCKHFRIISQKDKADIFILGSDTIWNLDSEYFKIHFKTYWGIDFFPMPVISYAASMANTNPNKVSDEMKNALSKYEAISVRDNHTFEAINDKVDKDVYIVCDPTLLLKESQYKAFLRKKRKNRYLYLYLFEKLTLEQSSQLKDYCRKNNLMIVNGGSMDTPSYCDQNSIISPDNFITDFYYADYVLTDTFHGAIFSIIFNKQFVVFDRGKNKVIELLRLIGLEERLFNGKDLIGHMTTPINYENVNQRIQDIREFSLDFLNCSLKGVSND